MAADRFGFYDPFESTFYQNVPSIHVDAAPPDGIRHLIFLAGAIKFWWLSQCVLCGYVDERKRFDLGFCPSMDEQHRHEIVDFWGSPDHRSYVKHRDDVRAALIEDGYLTYAPHEAFKGRWVEQAQAVNDAGIAASSLIIVMSPARACGNPVVAEGTDSELRTVRDLQKPYLYVRPGDSYSQMLTAVREILASVSHIR